MALIGSVLHKSATFQKNAENMRTMLQLLPGARRSGHAWREEAWPSRSSIRRGSLTARERIERLIDPGSRFLEIGLFAAYEMYEEYGGAPSSGTVFGIGQIHGRDAVIVANDATVKAGAWFPMTCKKNLRAQEIAMENRLPIVYLVDSAGVFLPLQSEIFPDKEHFGRIFRNNAVMSSMGIPADRRDHGSLRGGRSVPARS